MSRQEQICPVCLCKAPLCPGLDQLITSTAFTVPFPEAMYNILMVTLLTLYFVLFFISVLVDEDCRTIINSG